MGPAGGPDHSRQHAAGHRDTSPAGADRAAAHDKIINVADVDELAEIHRVGGAAVTYHRDRFSEHLLLHAMSAPMTLRWLRDRFAGRPLSGHLVRTTWPTLFNPSTHCGMMRLAAITAKVIAGRTVERSPLSKIDALSPAAES